jgi:hypothetical protein
MRWGTSRPSRRPLADEDGLKGRKNRHRREVDLRPSLGGIQEPIKRWLEQIGAAFKVVDFLFDGARGQNDARHMVRQVALPLVSQLRENSARSFP